MAKTKVDTNNQYLDAQPTMFSPAVQELLKTEREIYDMLKEQKAKVLHAVKAELPMPSGREVKRTAYTAWGQWQIVIGDVVAAKPASGSAARQSLSDFIATQQAASARH